MLAPRTLKAPQRRNSYSTSTIIFKVLWARKRIGLGSLVSSIRSGMFSYKLPWDLANMRKQCWRWRRASALGRNSGHTRSLAKSQMCGIHRWSQCDQRCDLESSQGIRPENLPWGPRHAYIVLDKIQYWAPCSHDNVPLPFQAGLGTPLNMASFHAARPINRLNRFGLGRFLTTGPGRLCRHHGLRLRSRSMQVPLPQGSYRGICSLSYDFYRHARLARFNGCLGNAGRTCW